MEQYSRVELITDKFVPQGVFIGDLGYIIGIYPDGAMEVEFSDINGITFAQLVLHNSDLKESIEYN